MTETTTRPPTTAEIRQHRTDTREKADSIAWTLDRLKRQQFSKEEKAEMRRDWGARSDDHLRALISNHVQSLRSYADNLTERHPEAFSPLMAVEELAARVEAGDPPAPEVLAGELRFVAAEIRGYRVLR